MHYHCLILELLYYILTVKVHNFYTKLTYMHVLCCTKYNKAHAGFLVESVCLRILMITVS